MFRVRVQGVEEATAGHVAALIRRRRPPRPFGRSEILGGFCQPEAEVGR